MFYSRFDFGRNTGEKSRRKLSNMDNLLSIIIPVYNVEKYLDETVLSLINQQYKNIEILLIDDGSTDKSGKICDYWEEKDSRIQVFHEINGGVSSARNKGLENYHGDYVCFVDADDTVSKDMYIILINALTTSKADIASCSYYYEDEKGKWLKGKGAESAFVSGKQEAVLKCLEMRDIFPSVCLSVYKRSTISSLRFREDLSISEDCLFNYLAVANCNKYAHIGECLYYYHNREDSALHSRKKGDTNALRAYDCITYDVKERFPEYYEYAERLSIIYRLTLIRDYYQEKRLYDCYSVIEELQSFKYTYAKNNQLKNVFKALVFLSFGDKKFFLKSLNTIFSVFSK